MIVGGGDGRVLREVLKHPVKGVYLVEIDRKVVEVSKKYLPSVSKGAFNDERVKIFIEDGASFIKKFKDYFDVVIIDSTSPVGPSLSLYSSKFYKRVFRALKRDGMMMIQIGSFLDFQNLIKPTFLKLKKIFPYVQIYKLTIPSYHCGEYCFIGASKKINLNKINFKRLKEKFKNLQKKVDFKYFSPDICLASMILPEYIKEKF